MCFKDSIYSVTIEYELCVIHPCFCGRLIKTHLILKFQEESNAFQRFNAAISFRLAWEMKFFSYAYSSNGSDF